MTKNEMPTIQMHVRADGTFEVVINDKMYNAKMSRDDADSVEWISAPKDERDRKACLFAASWLVGLLPRVEGPYAAKKFALK